MKKTVTQEISLLVAGEIEFDGATLLSIEEAETLLNNEEREYKGYWWLCTPGYFSYEVCHVYEDGYISYDGCIIDSRLDIRPALKIKNLHSFKVGDYFNYKNCCFKIISPSLAWLYKQDIGKSYFDENSNIYEESHIKTVVDKWYENLMN